MSDPGGAERLSARFARAMDRLLDGEAPETLGLAVSGGGDSMAMLELAHDWAKGRGVALRVATVNHNLRAEAADEAALVARRSAALGLAHAVLDWHWDGTGNLQEAAREGRLALLGRWRGGTAHILFAHTADDQAETVLLRLARGSGVDGLAGMPERRFVPEPGQADGGWHILRPLLDLRRAELRDFLAARGVGFAEDPSNDDPRFDRVRARKMAGELSGLGLTTDRLVRMAARMRGEAAALRFGLRLWCEAHVEDHAAELRIAADPFDALPETMATRLLASAVAWFSGRTRKPRASELQTWMARLREGGAAPLGGVLGERRNGRIALWRELAAVSGPAAVDEAEGRTIWDGRWQVEGPPGEAQDLHVSALGARLSDCPGWRETGLPRAALMASPAVFRGEDLVAAPLAQPAGEWRARPLRPFLASLDSR